MAELVHLRLEHGLKELEEMQRIKLFTREEIRKLAKKRKVFEYRLRRRLKSKEDILQYIEFEISLLLLISKRRERLLIESKRKEIDNSIAKKINRLFKAATSKYPEDVKLWLNQIEYYKRMKWKDSIDALFTKALQIHTKRPDLWDMAAKWQVEECNSFTNARRMYQKGLHANPKSEILWREYFRMELQFIDMVRKRMGLLKSQNKKTFEDASETNDSVLKGRVVDVVFDEAIKEIPDAEFALSFLGICKQFDFAGKQEDYILYVAGKQFPDSEETLDALAKQPLLHAKERTERLMKKGLEKQYINHLLFKEIYSKYDEAVETIPTEKMWSFYLDFLFKKLENCKTKDAREKTEILIFTKLEVALESGGLPMEYHIRWSKLLFERGDIKRALFVALSAAHKWNKVKVWLECLLLHIRSGESKDVIYLLIIEALSVSKGRDSIQIWKLGVDWLTMTDPEKLMEFFEKGIARREEIRVPIQEMYLEAVALRNGIVAARHLYTRFKLMGSLSPIIHQKMVKIERAQVNPSLKHIRTCYEDMIKEHGRSNVDVWLEFMQFEAMYSHDPDSFSMLQWRGKKTLQPELVDEFQTRITNLLTGGQIFTDKDLVNIVI